MSTLYQLTAEYEALLSLGDSDDPEDQRAFMDTLEGLTGEIEVKADSYAVVLAELKAQREKVKAEKERLGRIEKVIENNERRMKERIHDAMVAIGKDKIKTDLHTFAIQKNGGLQPLVVTGDVPDNFTKVIIEPDNEKIRKALADGQALDFAHLAERGTHLEIR